jgi:hypothetical protein
MRRSLTPERGWISFSGTSGPAERGSPRRRPPCDSCWRYGNPREFVEVRSGGRKSAYSGVCAECVGKEER